MCCAVYHASVEARVTTNLTTSHLAYVISSGRRFAVLLFLSHIMQLYLSLFAVFHVQFWSRESVLMVFGARQKLYGCVVVQM